MVVRQEKIPCSEFNTYVKPKIVEKIFPEIHLILRVGNTACISLLFGILMIVKCGKNIAAGASFFLPIIRIFRTSLRFIAVHATTFFDIIESNSKRCGRVLMVLLLTR